MIEDLEYKDPKPVAPKKLIVPFDISPLYFHRYKLHLRGIQEIYDEERSRFFIILAAPTNDDGHVELFDLLQQVEDRNKRKAIELVKECIDKTLSFECISEIYDSSFFQVTENGEKELVIRVEEEVIRGLPLQFGQLVAPLIRCDGMWMNYCFMGTILEVIDLHPLQEFDTPRESFILNDSIRQTLFREPLAREEM